jgi:hypothetical protein
MYSVGQVLFIILNRKQQVIPCQVTEQVVRRSLSGEETTYSVSIPSRNENKIHELDTIDGEVFESIEDVRKYMLEQTTTIIGTITEKALAVARSRFEYDPGALSDVVIPGASISRKSTKDEKGTASVVLGDGTVANVKLPDLPNLDGME